MKFVMDVEGEILLNFNWVEKNLTTNVKMGPQRNRQLNNVPFVVFVK
jgi:hypothetical protein